MKKTLAISLVLGVLSFGAVASAHMWGGPGGGGFGPGWGGGPAWGGPGWGVQSEEGKKFFEATSELRKKLHEKMFEYREAYRAGDEEKAEALDKEIGGLRTQLSEKAKETEFAGAWGGPRRGFGPRGGGFGPGACGGPGWGGGPYGGR